MKKHEWREIRDTELECCAKCHGYEGATTTDCPGKIMSYDTMQRVYKGEIDFRNGEWCNQPAIGMSHVYGVTREPYTRIKDPDGDRE